MTVPTPPWADLTREEMAAALDAASLNVSPGSPLVGLAGARRPAAPAPAAKSLQAKGVLTGAGTLTRAWRAALQTLAAPARHIYLFLGSTNAALETSYYTGAGPAVSHAEAGGGHRVAFPATRESALALCGRWMGWQALPASEPLSLDLGADELTALAALADAYREDQLRSFLQRQSPASGLYAPEALARLLRLGKERRDVRWLAGLLAVHAPGAFAPDPARLDRGLQALVGRGWLRRRGKDVGLRPPLDRACFGLSNLMPYLVLGSGPAAGQGSFLLAFLGLGTFWAVRFDAAAGKPPRAQVNGLGGALLEAEVENVLASTLASSPAPPVRPEACPKCGTVPGAQARFCRKCGTPLRRPAPPAPAGPAHAPAVHA